MDCFDSQLECDGHLYTIYSRDVLEQDQVPMRTAVAIVHAGAIVASQMSIFAGNNGTRDANKTTGVATTM